MSTEKRLKTAYIIQHPYLLNDPSAKTTFVDCKQYYTAWNKSKLTKRRAVELNFAESCSSKKFRLTKEQISMLNTSVECKLYNYKVIR